MTGILVMGDSHLIGRGPFPGRGTAVALARHWRPIHLGQTTPAALQRWSISTREFRENLEWAVVVPGDGEVSPAVRQLLEEVSVRGITIFDSSLSEDRKSTR